MRLVRLTLLLSCLAAVLVPAQATAADYAFHTSDPITIPHQGLASPYPSTVFVSGARGPVSDIEIQLHGLNHQTPDHLDLLLQAPDAGPGAGGPLWNAPGRVRRDRSERRLAPVRA